MAVLDPKPIVAALRGAFARGASRSDLLQLVADRIQVAGPPYTSVYLYMLQGTDLVLEALAGRTTEHTRIAIGHGICGTAIARGEDQNVGDVTTRENYLACNVFTRSELVVLIRRGDLILGQVDIDSDVPDPFTEEEEHAVRAVADALAVLL